MGELEPDAGDDGAAAFVLPWCAKNREVWVRELPLIHRDDTTRPADDTDARTEVDWLRAAEIAVQDDGVSGH